MGLRKKIGHMNGGDTCVVGIFAIIERYDNQHKVFFFLMSFGFLVG